MSGYTGDFADAKLIKSLDDEDTDIIGPGTYTLKGGAAIQGTAQFGSALLCDASGDSLESDSAVAGIDQSDTAKTITHIFARTDGSLTAQRAFYFLGNSTLLSAKLFYLYGSDKKILLRWNRATTLGAGPRMQVKSLADEFTTGSFFGIVGFIDADSETQGKIFKDGVDITESTGASAGPASATSGFDFLRIGNQEDGLAPGKFLDHLTIVQSSSLNDTKAASLASNYSDTRGFGYRPAFISTDISEVDGGDIVVLIGSGFGQDVTITVGGVTANNIVRTDEANVSFEVPAGLGAGTYDLAITNVASNVTFTQTAALSQKQTTWIPGGTSDRQARVGDGQTVSTDWVVGGPTRWCDPNIQCTPWVKNCNC